NPVVSADPVVSIIVPLGKRHAQDIAALIADYRVGLDALRQPYELIIVMDGAKPEGAGNLQPLLSSRARSSHPTNISLTRRFGEATALMAGFQRARGATIVTLPAYYQIQGAEVAKLVQ